MRFLSQLYEDISKGTESVQICGHINDSKSQSLGVQTKFDVVCFEC